MYVGVQLDANNRQQGVRPKQIYAPPLDLPGTPTTPNSAKKLPRSQSFTPPSNRLTQPTKSSRSRTGAIANVGGPPTARSSATGGGSTSRSPHSARSPGGSRSPFATPGSQTNRSRPPTYSARLQAHEKTHSPSGRYHPDSQRRREIHGLDMHFNIDYYAPHGAPDNDRKMKESSWLCSQAFIESLRDYPDPRDKRPVMLPGEAIAFSGNTQSARRPHTEHVETAMRRRLSIAPADGEWLEEQVPQEWPFNVPEGEWRSVGPLKSQAGGVAQNGAMRHLARSRSGNLTPGRSQTNSPMGSSRFLASGASGGGGVEGDYYYDGPVEPTSPAGGGMAYFNR